MDRLYAIWENTSFIGTIRAFHMTLVMFERIRNLKDRVMSRPSQILFRLAGYVRLCLKPTKAYFVCSIFTPRGAEGPKCLLGPKPLSFVIHSRYCAETFTIWFWTLFSDNIHVELWPSIFVNHSKRSTFNEISKNSIFDLKAAKWHTWPLRVICSSWFVVCICVKDSYNTIWQFKRDFLHDTILFRPNSQHRFIQYY